MKFELHRDPNFKVADNVCCQSCKILKLTYVFYNRLSSNCWTSSHFCYECYQKLMANKDVEVVMPEGYRERE